MSHARIEEVSDSDDASDPSEGDIDDFADSDIMRQIVPKAAPQKQQQQEPQLYNPAPAPVSFPGTQQQSITPQDIAHYQCIYPIYFDASRTRAEGRRVPASLAMANPLAREIANACAALRLQPVFEAHKLHPQDWANPGRVRVPPLNDADKNTNKSIKNKHHLYILIAKWMKDRGPTTGDSEVLRRVRIPGLPGMPEDGKPWPKPPVPRGWKVNELVPAYSAAMTGGGVSENALRDMMKEMGGMDGMPGMPGMPGGAGGAPGGGMPDMSSMMSMLQGLGGGAGPSEPAGGAAGGGKKAKKGKGKA
ncbi:hypothetical protein PG985_008875 [Apiospora marii]|uniref:uncharacterized protein n=1 Tax=Apiospora marii TaxID=335849 RepID=UPI00312E4755